MNTVRLFLKRPTTWIGIGTALMFQLIFSVVWMTGYEGVTDRMDRLTVGIVNEDAGGYGAQVAQRLAESLPVRTEAVADRATAEERLDGRELQMIVRIPASFSADAAAADRTAVIEYTVNESNPSLIKSMMTGVATAATAEVNRAAVAESVRVALVEADRPAEQAAAAAAGLSERVRADVVSTHPVQGMNNQMVPMMLVLASYVGAMIMGMNMEQSSMMLAAQAGRWQRFAARVSINVVAAALVSLVGSALVLAFGGQAAAGFLALWGMQGLVMLTFLFVSQMFLLLFGLGGMLFNILTLSAQLVSSGALVPRELLSDFYHGLGQALPATYAVEGVMNVLFGGPGVASEIAALLTIAAAALAIGAAAAALKRVKASRAAAAPAAAGRA